MSKNDNSQYGENPVCYVVLINQLVPRNHQHLQLHIIMTIKVGIADGQLLFLKSLII